MSHRRVLIPNWEQGAGLAIALRLKAKGFCVFGTTDERVATPLTPSLLDGCAQVRVPRERWLRGEVVAPSAGGEDYHYAEHLLRLALQWRCSAIWPIYDPDIFALSSFHERFNRSGITLLSIAYGRFIAACHKKIAADVAQCFFPATPDVVPLEEMPGTPRFPLVVKAGFSSGSKGIAFINNQAELELQKRKQVLLHRPLFAQRRVIGSPISVYVLRNSAGENLATFCLRKLNHLSPSVSTRCELFQDVELQAKALSFCEKLSLSGLLAIQTLVNEKGQAIFLECNCRPGNNTRILQSMIPNFIECSIASLYKSDFDLPFDVTRTSGLSPFEDLVAIFREGQKITKTWDLIKWLVRRRPAIDVYSTEAFRSPKVLLGYYRNVLQHRS